ncbi:MAG TPA: SAM-dependent methyltransferase [Trebonia sp.]|nr:SAM-dependent methyltransferase [Trebonia sp.]
MTEAPVPEIDVTRPHPARMYDYCLGGKNHYAADREVADKVLAGAPSARTGPQENRAFLGRAVRFLTAEAGIRQFLDIGTGLPTSSNVHEAAQQIAPSSRVVYVDNDPVVVNHLHVLLAKGNPGVAAVDGDVRDAETILAKVSAGSAPGLVDLKAPMCLIMGSLLQFFEPDAARDLVARYIAELAPGSYLVLSVGGPVLQHVQRRSHAGAQPPGCGDSDVLRPAGDGAARSDRRPAMAAGPGGSPGTATP